MNNNISLSVSAFPKRSVSPSSSFTLWISLIIFTSSKNNYSTYDCEAIASVVIIRRFLSLIITIMTKTKAATPSIAGTRAMIQVGAAIQLD